VLAEPDSIPLGERKTVMALFADIKGLTELIADLNPEEARSIIDPALKLMIDAVHHYDGYVVQSTGDGIFALFGAPIAHEDHPQLHRDEIYGADGVYLGEVKRGRLVTDTSKKSKSKSSFTSRRRDGVPDKVKKPGTAGHVGFDDSQSPESFR
jgi:class 3 adenylate cyclase